MTQAVQANETPLPRAVRAQMERVRLLQAKPPADAAPNPAPAPAAVGAPAALTETDPPAPPAPAPAPAVDARENDPAYWRQRFQVTQGMLRTQQDAHAADRERWNQEMTELRDKVRSLESSTAPSKVDLGTFFTPEQIDAFGEAQCQAMATAAIKAAGQQAQALIESEVKPMRERAQAEAAQAEASRESAFWDKLAELQPNYQEVNARQDWLEWLTAVDDATGLVRQDILDRHRGARNAPGVAKLFRAFEAGLQRPTPPVAPPRSAAPQEAPPAAPSLAYPKDAEIKEFYKRAKLGKVSDKERVEFEARLRSKPAA